MISVRGNFVGKSNVKTPFKNPVKDGRILIKLILQTQDTVNVDWILKLNVFHPGFHRGLGFRKISSRSLAKNRELNKQTLRNTAKMFKYTSK
jgi:hypothetical protein